MHRDTTGAADMGRFWTYGGGMATAASIALLAVALRPSASPARSPSWVAEGPATFVARGAGSCASASCHGGGTPLPERISKVFRNEHTTWITDDPHANAYDVLGSDRSERIARNLGKAGKSYIAAASDSRCLACHATQSASSAEPVLAGTIRRDGVGCESCHGPSGAWLSEHTRVDWDSRSPREKSDRFGLVDLRDLPTRAGVCAGCHVGAPADPARGLPARDVNHDLIAAGHPRLNWEYSAYVANYPKHWRQGRNPPDLDARLWKVGQEATLRAAADLLRHRAVQAGKNESTPWPELAESNCFSCHFALKDKPFRGRRDPGGPPLGVPSWGSWHLTGFGAIAKGDPAAAEAVAALTALRATMNRATPDAKEAALKASALRDALDKRLPSSASRPLDAPEVSRLIAVLNAREADGRRSLVTGWDSAAQTYLGLAALRASREKLAPAASNVALKSELEAFLKELAFPKGYDSPRDFGANPGR